MLGRPITTKTTNIHSSEAWYTCFPRSFNYILFAAVRRAFSTPVVTLSISAYNRWLYPLHNAYFYRGGGILEHVQSLVSKGLQCK